jgi:hypothetical protein
MRAAEVMASLSLATDIAIGVELEHGLRSTLLAMRLADRLGLDGATASETYYACLLFYVGCTADDDVEAEIFGGDLARDLMPATFGSRGEVLMAAVRHGCASGRRPAEIRRLLRGLPGRTCREPPHCLREPSRARTRRRAARGRRSAVLHGNMAWVSRATSHGARRPRRHREPAPPPAHPLLQMPGHPMKGFVLIAPEGIRCSRQLGAGVRGGVQLAHSLPHKG